jgi:hypothetical protein
MVTILAILVSRFQPQRATPEKGWYWKALISVYTCWSFIFTFIKWTYYSYRQWLQAILHNYRQVIIYISYGKSDQHVAYLHELYPMSCLCPRDEAAFLWRVAYCCWPVMHRICMLWIYCFVGIYCHVLNWTNWSTLEVIYRTFLDKLMCQQTSTCWPERWLVYQAHMKHVCLNTATIDV